ncbi:MAG: hypothetical protein WDN25_13460 [Acetobacteraceae bacterium]
MAGYTPKAPGAAGTALAVTKSDTTAYDPPLTALYVGGAGNVAIVAAGQVDADAVTLTAVPVGTTITGWAIRKVMATNTTATLLIGGR